jgi:Zn-dependent protease with chaperone function
MHVVIGGDGPPLLLVHGWPENWYQWHKLMPALARDYTVIAVDQRGFGSTDKPITGYDTGTLSNDLVALMDKLGYKRFDVVGADIGMVSVTRWPPITRTGSRHLQSPQFAEVQRVAKRIEAVASRDRQDFVWKVTLIRKNVANAYCLPGGKIVVYTAILPLAKNDAGLATVLGHEVSHATAEHAAEKIERAHLTEIAAAIVAGGVAFTPKQYIRVMALLGAGATLKFSRAQESEADHIGLVYMARAGYDPRQAVLFWKRMLRASKGQEPPEFLSDHPSDAHRVEHIESWLPEAERAYKPA